MPVANADLTRGTIVRWLSGDHRGLLTEIRRVGTNAVELRVLPGQSVPGNNRSSKRSRYSMPKVQVMSFCEVYKRPREKRQTPQQSIIPVSASIVASGNAVDTHNTDVEMTQPATNTFDENVFREMWLDGVTPIAEVFEYTGAKNFAELAEIVREHELPTLRPSLMEEEDRLLVTNTVPWQVAELEKRGVTRDQLITALEHIGANALLPVIGFSKWDLKKVAQAWGIPQRGKGFKPTGKIPAGFAFGDFDLTKITIPPRGRRSLNGNGKNGPVTVRKIQTEAPRVPTVAPTAGFQPVLDMLRAQRESLLEQERGLYERLENVTAELEKINRLIEIAAE